MGVHMTISIEMFGTICAAAGSIFTGIMTALYWLVKLRKDIDAAHRAIRLLQERRVRVPKPQGGV